MPAKRCEVCGRPEGGWSQQGGFCLRGLLYDGQASLPYVVACYRLGYERQKKRAEDLEDTLNALDVDTTPRESPAPVTPETRIKVIARPCFGVEFDHDMVMFVRTKFPGPVGVKAANAVHDAAFHRYGAQYNGVLTIAQIRDLPFGRLGPKTLEALKWLVGDGNV